MQTKPGAARFHSIFNPPKGPGALKQWVIRLSVLSVMSGLLRPRPEMVTGHNSKLVDKDIQVLSSKLLS